MHPLSVVFVALGLTAASRSASAQATHLVKLRADTAAREYLIEPAIVRVHPGDVVVFQVESGAPHSISFEVGGLSPQAHAALNAALPRRAADLSGPLLVADGAEYRFVVPAIPPGTYKFFCLPHRAYDERGTLRVE
ncbi:MAG: plastocyanin/azurin family copper-binding protein [Gemmatimonadales bacterium]